MWTEKSSQQYVDRRDGVLHQEVCHHTSLMPHTHTTRLVAMPGHTRQASPTDRIPVVLTLAKSGYARIDGMRGMAMETEIQQRPVVIILRQGGHVRITMMRDVIMEM